MIIIRNESGQSMVEYALIIGLIAVVAVLGLIVIGPKIRELFNRTNEAMDNAA